MSDNLIHNNSDIIPAHSFIQKPRNILIIILIIAACMRFIGLGSKSLWVDEVIASFVSTGGDLVPSNSDFSFIFWSRYGDVSPPLRDYIANISFRVFGVNEAALRFPSAVFGVLSVWLIYLVGKKWFNERVGLIAAFLLTISPYHLSHSQGGRMYTVFIFFSLVALYCLYKALYSEKRKFLYWFGFVIWNTLNIYLTYFGFWALITQIVIGGVWVIEDGIAKEKSFRQVALSFGKIIICLSFITNFYLPWFQSIWGFVMQHIHAPIPYKLPFTSAQISKENARDYMYYLKPNWTFFKDLLVHFGVPGIGAYIYFIFSLFGIYKGFQWNKKLTLSLILWILIPILITFAPPAKELFFSRYISFTMTGYILLIGVGIWWTVELIGGIVKKHVSEIQFGTLCLYLLMIFTFYNSFYLLQGYKTNKQNWRAAVNYLVSNLKTGDIIVTGPYNAFWCVYYYAHQDFNGDRDEINKSKLGGEWCQLYLPGKTVGLGSKVNTSDEMLNLSLRFPRIWYISAYYRTYQYRNHAFYNFIESEFPEGKVFPGDGKDDAIYVFFHENPSIKPNPKIIWSVIK